jgi:hypothetical protein
VLLVAALAAGIALPMGHLAVKLISKRRRSREAAANGNGANAN